MPAHVEPYSARDLFRWLTGTNGGQVIAQTGSHLKVKLPDGRVVPAADPGSNHSIPTVLARKICSALGAQWTLARLRAEFGYQPSPRTATGQTRRRSARPSPPADPPDPRQLLRQIARTTARWEKASVICADSADAWAAIRAIRDTVERVEQVDRTWVK